MNIKQVVKFILLSLVLSIAYSFFFEVLFGILGAFLVDMKVPLSGVSPVKLVIGALLVLPVIATSARIIYKKIHQPKNRSLKLP